MIKVTDYISNYLAKHGVRDIFMISGGGAMHLNDSIGKHPHLKYICTHHEQAAAIAAEGYARATGRMAVVCVTSGPGGTNTMTGVLGQWLDSVPVVYISGQVKKETTTSSCPDIGLRQLGDQEIDIVRIVSSITKYAVMVKDPMSVRYHLERALHLAAQGRPGPVWLDIPLDVQAAMIDEKKLKAYDAKEDALKTDAKILDQKVKKVIELLKISKRPIFLAGQGVRIAGARDVFISLTESMNIPVLTSFCGADLIPSTHALSMGRPGTLGSRYANFALQNADLLISIGTRNNIRQISYTRGVFARSAKKVIVDIDAKELKKPTIVPDLAICADAKDFIFELRRQSLHAKFPDRGEWLRWCTERKKRYPVVLDEYWKPAKLVNPYCFMQSLSKALDREAVVVTGDGTACVGLFQAGVVTAKQRWIWNSGCAAMGYDIPASIGACFGLGKKPVVCLAGDGSSQMNLQELQTIAHHKLPIKIFILNNQGYLSIKQTQDSFFEGRRVACDASSGVSFPDMIKVAKAYGLTSQRISDHAEMNKKIKNILKQKGPVLCEVMLTPDQKFSPRVSSARLPDGRMVSKPLEDMYPFLDRKEFFENMLVAEYSEKN